MRIDRCLSLLAVVPLIRLRAWRPAPAIPVLMYHSISDDPEETVAPYFRLATPVGRFRTQMQELSRRGYRIVSLLDLPEHLSADAPLTVERIAVITFDDGFRDFLTAAWPVLCEFGFTATVFLPTHYIGDTCQRFMNRDCLSWEDVRSLAREGVTFGSHTVHHPRLVDLSETDLRAELANSRQTLEAHLDGPIRIFAHPYAFPRADSGYVERFRRVAQETGYDLALTTTVGRVRPGDDRLTLRRLPVNSADDPALFRAKLDGAYDWVEVPQTVLKRFKRAMSFQAPARR